MVKPNVKTPNKRKSFANNESPNKKPKVENGKTNLKPFTPKKQGQKGQQPTPKPNKKDKQIKSNTESPKDVKPFAGTKKVFKDSKKDNKQQTKNQKSDQSVEKKKKRKNVFSNLVATVKAKQGSKDPETLKTINEKMQAITSRDELSRTAKKKLSILNKLKLILVEGSEAVSAQNKASIAEKNEKKALKKAQKKAEAPQKVEIKKKEVKTAPAKKQVKKGVNKEVDSDAEEESGEEESDDDEAEAGDEEDSDEEGAESDDEEGDGEEEDDDDEEDDEDEEDEEEDDSEDEAPAPKGKSSVEKASKIKAEKRPTLDQLKGTELVKKGQTRFVLFVGNIPYDTTKQDLTGHFSKVGDIVDVRIPADKKTNKPRGFAYIEVKNEVAYEKCLSMHHSQLKGRRINVLYTQGGKKKGEDKKKEIKAKNMKLHALRKQGKLAGSVKQTQKRSFRRNKSKSKEGTVDN